MVSPVSMRKIKIKVKVKVKNNFLMVRSKSPDYFLGR
jgi:hypothetical protein